MCARRGKKKRQKGRGFDQLNAILPQDNLFTAPAHRPPKMFARQVMRAAKATKARACLDRQGTPSPSVRSVSFGFFFQSPLELESLLIARARLPLRLMSYRVRDAMRATILRTSWYSFGESMYALYRKSVRSSDRHKRVVDWSMTLAQLNNTRYLTLEEGRKKRSRKKKREQKKNLTFILPLLPTSFLSTIAYQAAAAFGPRAYIPSAAAAEFCVAQRLVAADNAIAAKVRFVGTDDARRVKEKSTFSKRTAHSNHETCAPKSETPSLPRIILF